jgi:RHS repeat-associated protein
VAVDGHGREVEWTQQTGGTGGALGTAGLAVVSTTYQVGGEPARVVQGTSDSPLAVARWTRHDSLGRMTLNAEPNTASGFDPDPSRAGAMRAWRYAYNDAGALVGTSDARGCGENLHHDSLGRLRAEDFSPCLAEHAPYSPITLANGAGAESFYRYDTQEPGQVEDYGVAPANLRGRLVATMDQAAHVRFAYDWRGRQTGLASRIARPSDAAGVWPDGGGDPGDRFGGSWFRRSLRYDNSGRVVAASSGATSPELMGADGGSTIELTYGDRGLPIAVGGSYGALVERVEYDADDKPRYVRHGDAASTVATYTYDLNRRAASSMVFRGTPALWATGAPGYEPPSAEDLPTLQQLVLWSSFRYDVAGMLERVDDLRNDADWPEGAKPVTQAYAYDRATRLVRADYLRTADDPAVAFTEAGHAVPPAVLPERVEFQSFSYDGRGNLQASDDDAQARYDRSLGRSRLGAGRAGPDQLRVSGEGAVAAAYDEAGNLVNLLVVRAGPCADAAGRCSHRFVYDWDEIGRLARARRWDYTEIPADDPAYPAVPAPPPQVERRYRYRGDGERVVASAVAADGSQQHDVDVFATLRLEAASYDETLLAYERTGASEVVTMPGIGRVVHRPGLPRVGDSDLHVLLEFGDHLGSTVAVVDRDTSELVQRTTYQVMGLADSDYRSPRWGGLSAHEGFTGKPEDAEVGLTYFGARYYQPALGRWISPDPLTVHDLEGDLNPYSYVDGRPSMAVDPIGLADPSAAAQDAARRSLAQSQGFRADLPGTYTIPVTVVGVAPELDTRPAAAAVPATPPSYPRLHAKPYTGVMRVLVNASPVVLGASMLIDPSRTLQSTVLPRMQSVVEGGLGATNTTSDLSSPAARQAGSAGQRAMSDTDQLLSIAETKILNAASQFAMGRILRWAGGGTGPVGLRDECPGGVCLAENECFLAGTAVATPQGPRAIESIVPGDLVLSRDEATGETAARRVVDTTMTLDRDVVALHLSAGGGDERLFVTASHPFHVSGTGWVAAADLEPGMRVGGLHEESEVLGVEPYPGRHTVFNLEVETTHNYFAGRLGAWAHNTCPPTVYADKVGPGRFAHLWGWIPLRGPTRSWWKVERDAMDVLGERYGCHSCGTFDPGGRRWIIDHQWVIAFTRRGMSVAYRGYPQCHGCAVDLGNPESQANQVRRIINR